MACFDNDVAVVKGFDGSCVSFELASYENSSSFWDAVMVHLF